MTTNASPIKAAELILTSVRDGGKVLICGNGGSAAQAQHLAAELMVRYRKERPPIPAVALTADTAVITAISNDYSYGQVFARQVEGLGKLRDVLIILSTSGRGLPLRHARQMAVKKGVHILEAPRTGVSVAEIQENQLQWLHLLCEELDDAF